MTKQQTATIDAHATCVTLINVYDVEPEKQADLAQLLSEVTESVIRQQPGFMSVSIHNSLDGKRVVNYAQWVSKAYFEDFMRKSETQAKLKEFAALAKTVSPGLFKVNSVHSEK